MITTLRVGIAARYSVTRPVHSPLAGGGEGGGWKLCSACAIAPSRRRSAAPTSPTRGEVTAARPCSTSPTSRKRLRIGVDRALELGSGLLLEYRRGADGFKNGRVSCGQCGQE